MFKCGLNLLLPNFNGCTVEAWRLLIHFIPHLTGCVFTYSCQVIRVSKMAKCLGWVFSDYLWRHSVTHFPHYITVTLWWAPWRLKSPASPWFTQPFIHMTSSLSRFWLSDLASCWVVRLNKDRVWLKNCFKTIEFCAANHCFLFSFSLVNWILRQNRKRNTNLFILKHRRHNICKLNKLCPVSTSCRRVHCCLHEYLAVSWNLQKNKRISKTKLLNLKYRLNDICQWPNDIRGQLHAIGSVSPRA